MKRIINLLRRFIAFIFIDESINQSQYEQPENVLKTQVLYSSLSTQFLIILSIAALISSLGLMSDSSVIIVGAMLIAPLMKPIMSFSYGITIGDGMLKLRSLITLVIGILLTLIISYLSEQVFDLHNMTYQMTNRIKPNLFDLGVAVASGIAAAIAMTRKNVTDSLPGVAIAVSLVPPLCVAGVSLSMGETNAFYGSLLLFLVNLFAIIISASTVFLLNGYGAVKHTVLTMLIFISVLSVFSFPLKHSLELIEDNDVVQTVLEDWLYENYPHNISIHPADLNDIDVIDKSDHIFIFLELKAPKDNMTEEQTAHIHSLLEKKFNRPVNLKVQFLLTQESLKYSHKKKDGTTPIYGKDFIVPRK